MVFGDTVDSITKLSPRFFLYINENIIATDQNKPEKILMQKIIFYIIALAAVCGMASCSSDDEAGKIELSKNQSSNVSVHANQTSGEIKFHAAAAWSAWTSATARGSEEIDWITLNTTNGSAGDVSLPYSLDYNGTGSSRSAYIIIVCEDERISIKITQTAEEDEDINEPSSVHPLTYLSGVMKGIFPEYRITDFDGNLFSYQVNEPYNEELVSVIMGNIGKCTFDYSGAPHKLVAETSYGWRYEITIGANNLASHIDAYFDNTLSSAYDLEYNGLRLKKFTQYKHGKVYETSELEWWDGDITVVKTTFDGGTVALVPRYSEVENAGRLMMFDTQLWIDMDSMELFYYCGLLGIPTKHLIASTTATEIDGGQRYTFSSKFDYSFDSMNRPIQMVYTEIEDGEGSSVGKAEFAWKDAPKSNM
ncbi:MAG: DUF4595 domain-containing protein [Muribaculaceae bacterium]|nr:DUF4595 domain-containing protein [Muribaculaceae bacterium]